MKRAIAVLVLLINACGDAPPPALRPGWRWPAPPPAYVGMPAANEGDVAATYGHSVLVLLRGGRERWRAERVGLRDVAPTFDGAVVLAATDDGVVAFARADGKVLWEKSLGDRASTPVVAGDRVIATTWDGRMVALDGWSVTLPGPSLGPPAASGDVVVASWDSGVLAADVASGRLLWRHEFDGDGTSAPTVVSGVAVVVGGDRRAHAYDLPSGHERWSVAMSGAGSPEAPPAAGLGLVAIADRLGRVAVVDGHTGHRRWPAAGDGAVERGGPVFVGGAVALPLDEGRVLVAIRHGHAVHDPPGRVSGVAVSGGILIVATREAATNDLHALRVGAFRREGPESTDTSGW
jgi:outer membrane protein assembly factor BamB